MRCSSLLSYQADYLHVAIAMMVVGISYEKGVVWSILLILTHGTLASQGWA